MIRWVLGNKKTTILPAGFGSDFNLSKKGKYGIRTKFELADGKIRAVKFSSEVK